MSLSSNSKTDAKPPVHGLACQGKPCDHDARVSADWQALSIRFDGAVFAADLGEWIENDLAALQSRLGQFASSASSVRTGR